MHFLMIHTCDAVMPYTLQRSHRTVFLGPPLASVCLLVRKVEA